MWGATGAWRGRRLTSGPSAAALRPGWRGLAAGGGDAHVAARPAPRAHPCTRAPPARPRARTRRDAETRSRSPSTADDTSSPTLYGSADVRGRTMTGPPNWYTSKSHREVPCQLKEVSTSTNSQRGRYCWKTSLSKIKIRCNGDGKRRVEKRGSNAKKRVSVLYKKDWFYRVGIVTVSHRLPWLHTQVPVCNILLLLSWVITVRGK